MITRKLILAKKVLQARFWIVKNLFQNLFHFINLTAPPNSASISVAGTGSSLDGASQVATLIDGMAYTFTCDIAGADEEPDVTWTLTLASSTPTVEMDTALTSGVDCSVAADSETFDLTADLTEHDGQTLTCDADNSAGDVQATVTLKIVGKLGKFHFITNRTKCHITLCD